MRNLSAKQKKALEVAVNKYYAVHKSFPVFVSDLPENLEIYNMNPNEMFYQNANRFISDITMKATYQNKSNPF